ncbi:MAG: glycogen/starch synthase [Oscillospiraceae bacterium]|nr:glycogen/starch synthase [Lachnospiraceae bacterium]MBQ1363888.1 glycogen/starch synthase [Oscillospiraceae bacterium]
MKILFATSECAPFSKSGGLADVAFSLPPALKKAGDEVEIITPYYQCVKKRFGDKITYVKDITVQLGWRSLYCGLMRGELNGVTVWFVDNQEFFDRPKLYGYDDDPLRFAFFSRAVIDLLPEYSFRPDIIHCNDWETALVIMYLKSEQVYRPELKSVKTVYTIHNIAYQGQYAASMLEDVFGLDGGWYAGGLGYEYEHRHDINLMKGAMLMADAVSTVSPNYARELHFAQYAYGLQDVVDMIDSRLFGILNGIDEEHYNPATDPVIPANFSPDNMAGKAKCKREIQKQFDLIQAAEWPLLGFVARLNEQKGIELMKQILPGLMDLGIQLIVFGQGDQQYVDYFNWAKAKWPGMVGFSSNYNEETASAVFAGADMYLMPSRFEPCGLSQMMAMRYGTVPIVHATGGLRDSVRAYKEFDGLGTGFSFVDYTAKALYLVIVDAIKVYFGDREMFNTMRRRCMEQDLSWEKSAVQYQRMYAEIADLEHSQKREVPFEKAYAKLRDAYYRIDVENRRKHPGIVADDYDRVIQIHFFGRSEGTMYTKYAQGELEIQPYTYKAADAYVDASYDTLVDIASGKKSFDNMFLNGQIKISGNLSKGYEMRKLLAPIPGEAPRSVRTVKLDPETQEEKGKEAPKAEVPKTEVKEAPKAEVKEAPKAEAPKAEVKEAPKAEAPKAEVKKAPAKKAPAKKAPAKKAPAKKAPAKKPAKEG